MLVTVAAPGGGCRVVMWCVLVCVCVSVCVCICAHDTSVYMYIHRDICKHTYAYVYIYIHACILMYVCLLFHLVVSSRGFRGHDKC